MNKTLKNFFAGQEKKDLYWRPMYWVMSMLTVLEVAKAISEVAVSLNGIAISLNGITTELRKTRLNLL